MNELLRVTPVRTTIALCLGIVATVLGLFVYSVLRTPVASADQLRDMGVFILPRPREIAPFELTSHTGGLFDRQALDGQWSFLFFGFTRCPDICPTTLAAMALAELRLRELEASPAAQFQGIFVSVDPEFDDADRLAAYVGAFSENLLGVSGPISALAVLTEQLNVAFAKVPAATTIANTTANTDGKPAGEPVGELIGEPIGEPTAEPIGEPIEDTNGELIEKSIGAYQVDHTANIVIVNPQGHYHGFIKFPQQADTIVTTFQSLAANF